MGNLSPNLSRYEMACECGCRFDTVDIELVGIIQMVCDHFGQGGKVSLIVSGPNRCPEHNAATQGAAAGSKHQFGIAMDFKIYVDHVQMSPTLVYEYIDSKFPNKYGLGLYSNRTHFDVRTNGPARWNMT